MLPNFLGIGAQRCATTWIYECLKEHPEIFMPERKELHYFDKYYNSKNFEWYKKQFNPSGEYKAVGEYTPEYLYSTQAASRIRRKLDNPKFIISLRNPIQRAHSVYRFDLRRGKIDDIDFERALEKYPNYIKKGYYYQQIKNYFNYFPRKNFLILIYEDLLSDPHSFIKKIYSFLEVELSFVPSQINQRRNRGTIPSNVLLNFFLRKIDYTIQNRIPYSLAEKIRKMKLTNHLFETLFSSSKANKISPQTRTYLQEKFAEQNEKLSRLLGQDLNSMWN